MLSIHFAANTGYYISELTRQEADLRALNAASLSSAGLLPSSGTASFYVSHPHHAQAFGLADNAQFDIAVFQRLRFGRTVTGSNLRQHQKGKAKVEGFDFTFSAPKSLSVLWCLGVTEQNSELASVAWKIHMQAIRQVLDLYSNTFAFCRKGRNGNSEVTTGTIAGAIFNHYDARPSGDAIYGDPQLHSHCVIFNSVYDGKKFRALDARPIMKKEVILTLGQAYQKVISDGLYDHQIDQILTKGAEGSIYPTIAAIPQPLISGFSRRSNAIRQHSAANGISRQTSALVTRQPKESDFLEQLTHWRKVFQANRFSLHGYRDYKPASKQTLNLPNIAFTRGDFLSRFQGRNVRLSAILRRVILGDMGNPLVALPELILRLNASRLFTAVTGRIGMFRLSNRALAHENSATALHQTANRLSAAERHAVPQLNRASLQRIQELLQSGGSGQTALLSNSPINSQENSIVYRRTATPQVGAQSGISHAGSDQAECLAEEAHSLSPHI